MGPPREKITVSMFCHPELCIHTATQLETIAVGLDHVNVVAITEGPDNQLVTMWKHLGSSQPNQPLRSLPNDSHARRIHRQTRL
jgi:hypothetical protein